jgi:hypothetical protein
MNSADIVEKYQRVYTGKQESIDNEIKFGKDPIRKVYMSIIRDIATGVIKPPIESQLQTVVLVPTC